MQINMVPILYRYIFTFIDLILDLIECIFKDVCIHAVNIFHSLIIFLDTLGFRQASNIFSVLFPLNPSCTKSVNLS